jgi:hypothetical protein
VKSAPDVIVVGLVEHHVTIIALPHAPDIRIGTGLGRAGQGSVAEDGGQCHNQTCDGFSKGSHGSSPFLRVLAVKVLP